MPTIDTALGALEEIESLRLRRNAPLSQYTRFGIGGPAALLAETADEETFLDAFEIVRASGLPHVVIAGGTNLIVSDAGYDGIVLRYTAAGLRAQANRLYVEAGAVLQNLVNFSITRGLEGLHTMTGIPGWVGAAVYGNAGAYGHSISEFVRQVHFYDGLVLREFDHTGCQFAYRESIFKKHKEWILLSAVLELPRGDKDQLQAKANEILAVRNEKYPPTMKCAGSIFKNLLFHDLTTEQQAQVPDRVVREGKVPSAWFLEQVGAKGMRRGDIQVATYHANLIYNDGHGTSAHLAAVIHELKQRVVDRFGLMLEEEVQYVGFER